MLCFQTNTRKCTDLFQKINLKCKDLGLEFNSPKLRVDYESAPISVTNELFPSCQLCGCNFHFNQCLWRKVQYAGLSVLYTQKESIVRVHVHSTAALAHLRPADVHDGWIALLEECPTRKFLQLDTFSDYFVQTWLGDDAKITVNIWNVHSENEKWTNNQVEGWNSRFTRLVGRHHPNIFEFWRLRGGSRHKVLCTIKIFALIKL